MPAVPVTVSVSKSSLDGVIALPVYTGAYFTELEYVTFCNTFSTVVTENVWLPVQFPLAVAVTVTV